MIPISVARELLDFGGGLDGRERRLSRKAADDQLAGAVAVHNILQQRRVAYLADEVGLGKTYVALGAFALFRHFHPEFRVLVIAPKENIQRKWIKEMHNFVRNNVLFPDLRVKSVHGLPARPAVYCKNLEELVRETALDPDRDFFARLTSFSFGLTDDSSTWGKKRDAMLDLLPWFPPDLFDLHSKDRFKENYARAVCCALPVFDLVIFDEGHNLKGGLQKSRALRNQLLALAFGNDRNPLPSSERKRLKHYGARAKRLLFLSATPIEDNYQHIWNQLDVFAYGDVAPELADRSLSDEAKRAVVSTFLIRRVSKIPSAGIELTKNLYRRQWRAGGVEVYDQPLATPDDRQRLIVALVQKKISELLASERFQHSFQIGMLASFESFFRTAKVAREADDSTFDDAQQTDDVLEREGIDVDAVNSIGRSYKKHFGTPMPHPKMDALVQRLKSSFDSGRKALIFVRRVASVKEIEQKLEVEYDTWLFARLRNEIRPELRPRLEKLFEQYQSEKQSRRIAAETIEDISPDEEQVVDIPEDTGGIDTFFAWYFRGEGPRGVLSAAAVADRFNQSRFALSSFFADNYAARLLRVQPNEVLSALAAFTKWPADRVRSELERRAGAIIGPKRSPTRSTPHLINFMAFQQAAVEILRDMGHTTAAIVLNEVLHQPADGGNPVSMEDWVERPTFFTALRQRETLRRDLWPEESSKDFGAAFRREELRREAIASAFRRGHSYVDLYIAIVNRLGALTTGGEDIDNEELAGDVLDMLERQRDRSDFRAYHELCKIAEHFDLILDTNIPDLWTLPLDAAPREIGNLLRAQQPVGGMFGEVNRTLVRQFRMPGYPFALVTTDLLQEGEDLHLFCSDVYHYGISWMPSSMEQRIGRIDRVRSQTERRITQLGRSPDGDELMQVYYPYLKETVELFQVNKVLERMDKFIRLMHESLGTAEENRERKINLLHEIQLPPRPPEIDRKPLRSAFPVHKNMLRGNVRHLAVEKNLHDDLLQRFWRLQERLTRRAVAWQPRTQKHSRAGQIEIGDRKQSFEIFLHSISGKANIRCVSPIGNVEPDMDTDDVSRIARPFPVRICAVFDPRFRSYTLTAESDVLLGDLSVDEERAHWLIFTTAEAADRLEETIFNIDADISLFTEDLEKEPSVER